jgi:hypothetical protein
VAEWLRSGLQIRAPRFDSGRGLHSSAILPVAFPGRFPKSVRCTCLAAIDSPPRKFARAHFGHAHRASAGLRLSNRTGERGARRRCPAPTTEDDPQPPAHRPYAGRRCCRRSSPQPQRHVAEQSDRDGADADNHRCGDAQRHAHAFACPYRRPAPRRREPSSASIEERPSPGSLRPIAACRRSPRSPVTRYGT